MLSDVLKRKDIYTYFSRSAMEKAVGYQAQGRVSGVEVCDDLTRIRSQVRGSEGKKYRVDIQLKFERDALTNLRGDCSCPMAFNCKHVAATLLEVLNGKAPPALASEPVAQAVKPAKVQAPSAPPALGYEVNTWIDSVGRAARSSDYATDESQRLLYCLHPSNDAMPYLAVSLRSVRLRKGGDYADNYSSPSPYEFKPERAPKYFRDVDVEIVTEVNSRVRNYYAQGAHPEELLHRIVATGRAFWLDHKRAPLSWGDAREGRIEWQNGAGRGVVPHLVVSGAVALNAEPPVYVDEADGMIGPVQLGLPPRLASQFLAAPSIPRAQLEEVSRRLSQKLPELHHGLLPVPPVAAVLIDEDPRPVLRLKLGHLGGSYYYYYRNKNGLPGPIAVASLGFRYGLGEARSAFAMLDYRHATDLTLRDQRGWFDFLTLYAEQLRSEGFEILIDDDFPFRLAESSGDFDAALESSGIDWFELALGIEIDGERRDLAPLLAALVSEPASPRNC